MNKAVERNRPLTPSTRGLGAFPPIDPAEEHWTTLTVKRLAASLKEFGYSAQVANEVARRVPVLDEDGRVQYADALERERFRASAAIEIANNETHDRLLMRSILADVATNLLEAAMGRLGYHGDRQISAAAQVVEAYEDIKGGAWIIGAFATGAPSKDLATLWDQDLRCRSLNFGDQQSLRNIVARHAERAKPRTRAAVRADFNLNACVTETLRRHDFKTRDRLAA